MGDRVDLLMIGPLTNLALALRRAPGITRGIGRLTIMGGTVYGRGNVTPVAEFNIFATPRRLPSCSAPRPTRLSCPKNRAWRTS